MDRCEIEKLFEEKPEEGTGKLNIAADNNNEDTTISHSPAEPESQPIDPLLTQTANTPQKQADDAPPYIPWHEYTDWLNTSQYFYWEPYGHSDMRIPVQADRFKIDCLLEAEYEKRLYISQQQVKSPHEALMASCWYWQKRNILPSPDELATWENMTMEERWLRGVEQPPRNSLPHDPVIQPIVATLRRFEDYSRHMTGTATPFRLGIIKEEVRESTPVFTAELPWAGRDGEVASTIWIHQRAICDGVGNVQSLWCALGDGTVPPPQSLEPQSSFSQVRLQHHIGRGKKRARSPSPEPTSRKRLQAVQSLQPIQALPQATQTSPRPTQALPRTTRPVPQASQTSPRPAQAPIPQPQALAQPDQILQPPLPPNPTAVQLQDHYFSIPYPVEATRRMQIVCGQLPPSILLDPSICPKEYILPGAKLLTNTVIIVLAQHFSNTDIFTRINQILTQPRPAEYGYGEEWSCLRDANVITRRITIAVESEAKRRGVDVGVVRQEIEAGRKTNGVVTGRGKGIRRKKTTTEDGYESGLEAEKKQSKCKVKVERAEEILDQNILGTTGLPIQTTTDSEYGDWLPQMQKPYFIDDDWMTQYFDTNTAQNEYDEEPLPIKNEFPFDFE